MAFLVSSPRAAVPAALWALLTALLLLAPASGPADLWIFKSLGSAVFEALGHLVLFFVQAVLLGSIPAGRAAEIRPRWPVAGATLAYALMLELLQIPVVGRSFELLDLAAAAIGVILYLPVGGALARVSHRESK